MATAKSASEQIEWFEREVRPLLAEHCYSCHASTILKPKGGLAVDSRESILKGGDSGPAATPGIPDDSLLVRAVRRLDLEMPPDKPLNKRQQDIIARWVEMGMPWPQSGKSPALQGPDWIAERAASHWAWQKIGHASVPMVQRNDWSARPVDQFILNQLETAQLAPAEPAPQHVLLRRLSFDLVGLPPTRQLINQFNEQPSEAEYERIVDQLMSSAQFGVKWGRHWFDLVRFAETLGHEFDYPVHHAWHYRDAVIDAFNCDVPYDHFVLEHIAGDLVQNPRIQPLTGINHSLAATAWWWLGDSVHAPVDLLQDEAGRLDHQIDVFSKTFFGMTVGCARCHDHKFDAISMQDYYALAGILQSSRRTYAPTDPNGFLARHNRQLEHSIREIDRSVKSSQPWILSIEDASQWLNQYVEQSTGKEKSKEDVSPSSPLYVLRQLAQTAPDSFVEEYTRVKNEVLQSQSAWRDWESTSPTIAKIENGLPAGWTIQSADSRGIDASMQRASAYDWFSTDGPLPAVRTGFSSHRLGRNQRVSLLSPTFTVTHPSIALQISGKSAKSTLIIDNYFMIEFHQLLFGDVMKKVEQPSDTGWIHHSGDLKKYIGRRAYLVIEDSGDGWFDLRQMRLANSPPPHRPHPITFQVVSSHANSLSQLIGQYARLLVDGYVQWNGQPNAGGLPDSLTATDQIELVRELWRESRRLGIEFSQPALAILEAYDRLSKIDAQCPTPTPLLATIEGTPMNSRVAMRGNPRQLSDLVERRTLSALGGVGPSDPSSSGRIELAKSIIDAEHPLTSRVMVNRVWHYLMGRGLVESPDNLGVLGGRPTNAELLDYLSRGFVAHQWSLKWLIREIVSSRTYRMASEPTERHSELDADGRLWSHRMVKRLTAEELRDAMLQLSGIVDLKNSGPSVPIHLTAQMTGRGRPKDSGPLDSLGRRSMFIEVRRNFLHPLLVAFDFPAPSATVGRRNVSNVPAQSLGMLNDPLVFELAEQWALRIAKDDHDVETRIDGLFLDAFSRRPSPDERESCRSFLGSGATIETTVARQRWTELTHVMLNAKEFVFLR